ncbi:MAG TPA: hypothetical protein VLC97_12425, partial [Rhodanobacteraceae bacterium]|nr:hypothetical protein [Rhodanobacteraceae bacterium]
GVEAKVSMTYTFVLGKKHEQKHATPVLQRLAPTECWLVDDLMGPRGDSLVRGIEQWFKEYGSAL